MGQLLNVWSLYLLSLMRAVVGFLFMQHGGQKIFGFPAEQRFEFDLFSMIGVAGALELVGGFLILIGLFTRPTAFLLSGLMAFAYFIAHASQSFWAISNNGEVSVLFAFIFLYMAAAGGGKLSIDRLLGRQ